MVDHRGSPTSLFSFLQKASSMASFRTPSLRVRANFATLSGIGASESAGVRDADFSACSVGLVVSCGSLSVGYAGSGQLAAAAVACSPARDAARP
jgi:hypothetical protein